MRKNIELKITDKIEAPLKVDAPLDLVDGDIMGDVVSDVTPDTTQNTASPDTTGSDAVNKVLDNINTAVDTVHKVSKIRWRHLLDSAFKCIFIAAMITTIAFIISIVHYRHDIIKWFGDSYVSIQSTNHDKNYNSRLTTLTPNITQTLKDMYFETPGAERTFMMEFHNGGNNIANIPFCKGTVTYDYFNTNQGSSIIGDVWNGVQLTNFFSYVCKVGAWRGYIEEINDPDAVFNDPSFYKRTSESGIIWMSVQVIYNDKGEKIGILGVCCDEQPRNTEQLNQILIKYSQRISREYSDMLN